ncbi:MAG: HAMP domain-containing histidine kinase [Nitrospinae bacterium]|nr:HAMP domain-containing histidine kinase [Nitrospinota bacterium]
MKKFINDILNINYPINPSLIENDARFQERLAVACYYRIKIIGSCAVFLYIFSNVMDYHLPVEQFLQIFILKILVIFIFLYAILFLPAGKGINFYNIAGAAFLWLTAALINAIIIHLTGGYDSYWVMSLSMVMVVASLYPWQLRYEIPAQFITYLFYIVPSLILDNPFNEGVHPFIVNNFYFVGFMFVSASLSYIQYRWLMVDFYLYINLLESKNELESSKESLLMRKREAEEKTAELEKTVSDLSRTKQALLNIMEDLRNSKKEMEETNIQLKKYDLLKSEFLANISHELRTPLTSVIGFSRLLMDDNSLSPDKKEYLTIISQSSNNLLNLINDLLDISKVEAGEMELFVHPTDINFTISNTIYSLSPMITEYKHTVVEQLDQSISEIEADPRRVQQIVSNLLVNAVKYTPQGGQITVTSTNSYDEVWVTVRDTGVGISPENLGVIFDRFRQVDGSTTRKFGGIGIGLDLTKALVNMHGGRIWVESEPGKGSAFTVALPKKYKGKEQKD